jgi:hypothetical protein
MRRYGLVLCFYLFTAVAYAVSYPVPFHTREEVALFLETHPHPQVVSGAGIAGLITALTMRQQGHEVVVFEKRESFTRDNVINLAAEVQLSLDHLGLLEAFEAQVAARIERHIIIQLIPDTQHLAMEFGSSLRLLRSVSPHLDRMLQPRQPYRVQVIDSGKDMASVAANEVPIEHFFKEDGIYSVRIADVQNFLARACRERGVIFASGSLDSLLSSDKVRLISFLHIADGNLLSLKQGNLLFVSEGAHPRSDAVAEEVVLADPEKWVFANYATAVKQTMVVSIIDSRNPTLGIGNVIFNSHLKTINVAALDNGQEDLTYEYLNIAKSHVGLEEISMHGTPESVRVVPQMRTGKYDNVILIGDSLVSGSPLAGLGGTIAIVTGYVLAGYLNPSYPATVHLGKTKLDALSQHWERKSKRVRGIIESIHSRVYP